jgi:hypothetical protein
MHTETKAYNDQSAPDLRDVGNTLALEIDRNLPGAENKIWHAHPVWFIEGTPTVDYSRQKPGMRQSSITT